MIETCDLVKGKFRVKNEKGLHTRPAAELARLASRYKSEINLVYRKLRVNAKSLLGLLMLAAAKGDQINIEARGVDAKQAIEELCALSKEKFHSDY